MMKNWKIFLILIITISISINSCGGGKKVTLQDIENNQALKIVYKDGSSDEGIIKEIGDEKIIFVSEKGHKPFEIEVIKIRRLEKLEKSYDDLAYSISGAEINKYKKNRNTWGYAIGGAVVGAAAGLVLGLPLWLADVDAIPPYFWSGAGAVAGSIFFAIRGQEKDKDVAIQEIRVIRKAERELEEEIDKEKKQLEEIEKEKRKIKEKLKKHDDE